MFLHRSGWKNIKFLAIRKKKPLMKIINITIHHNITTIWQAWNIDTLYLWVYPLDLISWSILDKTHKILDKCVFNCLQCFSCPASIPLFWWENSFCRGWDKPRASERSYLGQKQGRSSGTLKKKNPIKRKLDSRCKAVMKPPTFISVVSFLYEPLTFFVSVKLVWVVFLSPENPNSKSQQVLAMLESFWSLKN